MPLDENIIKTKGQIDQDISEIAIKVLGRDISDEDKAEDWYANLVNSIGKMYEKGTKTVTTGTTRAGDGRTISGSKRVVTPSVAEADIDALIAILRILFLVIAYFRHLAYFMAWLMVKY